MTFDRVAVQAGFVTALLMAAPVEAAIQEPGFTETVTLAPGQLSYATGFAWAPDGSDRLFIILQSGAIHIVKGGLLLPQPFATVTPVLFMSECGLIGIAFDPAFLVTRHVYVMACVSATEQQIIRYTADGDLGTEKTVIVGGLPTKGLNHDGGGIGFGPDGKLYWGIGDLGGNVGVNADLASVAAKIGRANLDGSPAADNPFFDGPGPNADFTWARGFRNPFTLMFQPATGLLWVNDVGTFYEQIFIVRRGDHAGWSMYENNQPAGFITPVIKYRTNAPESRALAAAGGAVRSGGTVSFTTTEPHGLRRGERVTIAGVGDATFNGPTYIVSVPGQTTFTARQPGAAASSGGGTVSTTSLGGAVTGGAFYDSTAFPPSHRGNFFFGDYNGNIITRAAIDPRSNEVASVDIWASTVSNVVDVAIGPDGDLYYLTHRHGGVYRASYNGPQGLVVTPTNVWIGDGEAAAVLVRLSVPPDAGSPVTVKIERTDGDVDLGVQTGANLIFDERNWNQPQRVTVAAGFDLDDKHDRAVFAVSAPDLATETFAVQSRDQAGPDLAVSVAALALDEGASGSFTVVLSRRPHLPLEVEVERSAGDPEIAVTSGAKLSFDSSNWSAPQAVVVTAGAHAGAADRAATITVGGSGLVPRTVLVNARNTGAAGPADAGPVEARDAPAGEFGDAPSGDGGVSASEGDGCGCRLGGHRNGSGVGLPVLLGGLVWAWRRRSRRRGCSPHPSR